MQIANITNSNETNFTNIQNLQKTEQQQKDEVVEMIYKRHLQAQEWGNKLNDNNIKGTKTNLNYDDIQNINKFHERTKRQYRNEPSPQCTRPTLAVFTAGGFAIGAGIGSIVPGAGTIIALLVGGVTGIATGLYAGNNLCPKI